MTEFIWDALATIGTVVTVATVIVAVLERIAEITPSTRDDEYAATAKRWLGYVSYALDPLNVYTTKDKRNAK